MKGGKAEEKEGKKGKEKCADKKKRTNLKLRAQGICMILS
jgi:hypothetical protein